MSKTFCRCQFPTETVVDRVAVCLSCGGEIVKPKGPDSDKISEEELKFARSIIGSCQQIILKNQRMIDDVRKRYPGLKDEARP